VNYNDPLHNLKFKRGEDLPQAKLTNDDVLLIREVVEYRNKLKEELSQMTNKKLAEKFDVHYRTIDRVTAGENWCHV